MRRAFFLGVLLIASCSSSPSFQEMKSDVPKLASPASPDDVAATAQSTLAFSIDLSRKLAGDGNTFFSPHSIDEALMMTYAGAANATAAQMRTTLHLTLPDDRAQAAMSTIDTSLAADAANGGFSLALADAMWTVPGLSLQQPFLDTLARDYGAGVGLLDFGTDPEGARKAINDWVAKQTSDKIVDLLASGQITRDTKLVLANAAYFKAAWAATFAPGATAPEPFTKPDGSTVSAATMAHTAYHGLTQANGVTAVSLPYADSQVELVVVMPDDLGAFESTLTADALSAILTAVDQHSVNVELHLPKLQIRDAHGLVDTLRALGMVDAFTQAADFSGIDGARDLGLTEVQHQAWIVVDENGTEAAAATAVVGADLGAIFQPQPPTIVHLDHPFLMIVRDRMTGQPLFYGRVLDPTS